MARLLPRARRFFDFFNQHADLAVPAAAFSARSLTRNRSSSQEICQLLESVTGNREDPAYPIEGIVLANA